MGLFSIFKKSNTLYYPGDLTYFKFHDNFEIYKKIFSKLGIDFKINETNFNSGLEAWEAGYESEARKLIKKNFEMFQEEEITSIITNSPSCYKMFLLDYPEILVDWNIEPKNIWRMMLVKLESKPGVIKYPGSGIVAYNDSCYLGRYCETYEEPRKILELLGYEVREIFDNGEEAMCCGSCGGLPITNPEMADQIAKERLMQAKRAGIKKIVVCSFEEYELLKKNSSETGIEVLELSDVLGFALGLKKQEFTTDEKEIEEILAVSEDKEEESEEGGEDMEIPNVGIDYSESEPVKEIVTIEEKEIEKIREPVIVKREEVKRIDERRIEERRAEPTSGSRFNLRENLMREREKDRNSPFGKSPGAKEEIKRIEQKKVELVVSRREEMGKTEIKRMPEKI